MNEVLKNCPFCGASGMYVKPDEYGDGMFGVDGPHKRGCIIGNIDNCDYGEPAQAIAAWNRRATPAPMSDDTLIQKTAVALSMLDPDERALPEGVSMTAFYTQMARGVLSTIRPAIEAAAREAERAKVVAWLHTGMVPDHSDDGGCPADKFADAIERGEYRENGDG